MRWPWVSRARREEELADLNGSFLHEQTISDCLRQQVWELTKELRSQSHSCGAIPTKATSWDASTPPYLVEFRAIELRPESPVYYFPVRPASSSSKHLAAIDTAIALGIQGYTLVCKELGIKESPTFHSRVWDALIWTDRESRYGGE